MDVFRLPSAPTAVVALLALLALVFAGSLPAAGRPAVPPAPAGAGAGAQPARDHRDPALISPDALRNRSGLPLPRFATLRSGRAHMRAGPGRDYPVLWTFIRPGIPLEIVHEWNVWRRVRDADGTVGWMDRSMLGQGRSFQVTGGVRPLHARPDLGSPVVWRAEPGVVGRITLCAERWCRIDVDGRAGWILREHGFGTYPDEPVG